MDSSHQAATIAAMEVATDAMMVALRKRPDPDLDAAIEALRAREAAIRLLVGSDPAARPPDLNARLRRILDCDGKPLISSGPRWARCASDWRRPAR